MKKILFAAALAVSSTMSFASGAFSDMKVGTVDMMVLVRNHPNYDSNKTLLASTDKDYQKKIDAIKSEGEKVQEEGRKLAEQLRNPMLLAKAKGDIENQIMEIQKKLAQIEQRYRSEAMRCRQDLQDLEARLLKTTAEDIRKRLAKFAEKGGYDIVLDTNAAPYAKKEFDVTDEMLKAMGVDPKAAKGRDESK